MFYPTYDPTALFAGDFPHISRPLPIAGNLNAAGSVLPRGTVMGLNNGVATIATSSVTPVGILAVDVDTSSGPVPAAPIYFTGEFADFCLTLGSGLTPAMVDLAFATSGQPIFIRTVGSVA